MTDPPVTVREVLFQISATSVPKVVRERVGDDQTAVATSLANDPKDDSVRDVYPQISAGSDANVPDSVPAFVSACVLISLTAVAISALVFTSTAAATEASVTTGAFTKNVLSNLKRSPVGVDPQTINAGYFPSPAGTVY